MITRLGLSGISRGLYGSFVGKAVTIIETVKKSTGAPSRITFKPKRIMLGNQLYIVESLEQERDLIEKHLIKQRKEFTALLSQKKFPVIKKKIKLIATQINRTEARLKKADKKSWLANEDEEILILLMMNGL